MRKVKAALKRSEIEVDSMTSSFNDRRKAMEDRGEIKEPWRKLTEREPSASGPLLAAYDAVDAFEHRVEHQFTRRARESICKILSSSSTILSSQDVAYA